MDSNVKKKVLRQISYGMYVMTAKSGSEIGAGTVNWLSQASFNPPLIMAAVKADSSVNAVLQKSGTFAINVISASQKQLAEDFFRPTKVEGNKLSGHAFTAGGATGSPVLEEAYCHFECKVTDKIARGDHTVYVAEVTEVGQSRDEKPLEMWDTGWFYGG
ncbi:MAG: flavin reductase [Dehalococcoidia bacterium]|nr:flavin reductase [Dehalococcoidia bacterium]